MSYISCNKPNYSLSRGVTSTGYNLSGMSWKEARTIAADPNIIAPNSKVLIKFYDKDYHKYNGIYTCRDTGGAIKGNKIDFYLGDNIGEKQLNEFGLVKAKIFIIK